VHAFAKSVIDEPQALPLVVVCDASGNPLHLVSGFPSDLLALEWGRQAVPEPLRFRAMSAVPKEIFQQERRGEIPFEVTLRREYIHEATAVVYAADCARAEALALRQIPELTFRPVGPSDRGPQASAVPLDVQDMQVILSDGEGGFWCEPNRWVRDLSEATRYPDRSGILPLTRRGDAQFVSVRRAPSRFENRNVTASSPRCVWWRRWLPWKGNRSDRMSGSVPPLRRTA
jgi:hypothetical protein